MKFVPPVMSGQTSCLLRRTELGSTSGWPSGPISFAQVVLTNGLPSDELAVDAIERVEESVAIREQHDLARLAADA